MLGQLTVGLMLVTLGALWALDAAGVLSLAVRHVFGAALLVVGLGLLVGSVLGRSRGLIVLGIVLLPVTLIASSVSAWSVNLAAVPLSGGFGDRVLVPLSVDELPERLELTAGTLRVDLREITDATGIVPLEVRVGAGEVVVIVPDDAGLEMVSSLQAGELVVPNGSSGGFVGTKELGVDIGTAPVAEPGQPTYDLDVTLGAGELTVLVEPRRVDN